MIISNSLLKYMNYSFRAFSISLFLFYFFNSFQSNIYEVLFIDERMLIDDIYNVWLAEDLYNRFSSVTNVNLKKILSIIIELAYGGDLRYGRLWSNVFVILIGPLTLINDTVVIMSSRLLNSLLFFFGAYFLSKYLVDKKYVWFSVVTIYSLPAVEYFLRVPKPDTLVILLVAFGLNFFLKEKYYLSIFFLAVATFVKVTAFFIFLIIWFFIFLKSNQNKFHFIAKSFIISIASMLIVNPILIVPPLNFEKLKLPNFYSIYINWLTSQGSNGDVITLSTKFINNWMLELSNFYKVENKSLFTFLTIFFLYLIMFQIFQKKDVLSKNIVLIFSIYVLFYFLLIERAWTQYLHLPFALLIVAYFRSLNKGSMSLPSLISIIIFIFIGNFSNIDRFLNDTTFNMNTRLEYISVNTQEDAQLLVNSVIEEIRGIYDKHEHLNKKLVYWHPDLITARNNVTYVDTFYVREYWGDKDKPDYAINQADIFVTYTNYDAIYPIRKIQLENFFIYYYEIKN